MPRPVPCDDDADNDTAEATIRRLIDCLAAEFEALSLNAESASLTDSGDSRSFETDT
jgi:hypothetical protein